MSTMRDFSRPVVQTLAMVTLLENGLPAAYVMEAVKGPLVIRKQETPSGT